MRKKRKRGKWKRRESGFFAASAGRRRGRVLFGSACARCHTRGIYTGLCDPFSLRKKRKKWRGEKKEKNAGPTRRRETGERFFWGREKKLVCVIRACVCCRCCHRQRVDIFSFSLWGGVCGARGIYPGFDSLRRKKKDGIIFFFVSSFLLLMHS